MRCVWCGWGSGRPRISATNATRVPCAAGGGVRHSTDSMFSYQTGAFAGSDACAATSARGRPISIWVRTSTGTSPGYRLASGQVVEDLGLAGDRRRAPGEHDRLGAALVSHLALGAPRDTRQAVTS